MKISMHSDIGLKRTSNQDYANYYYSQQEQVLWILCDGVGGNLAGDVASQKTTEFIGHAFQEVDQVMTLEESLNWMESIIQESNKYILALASQDLKWEGMGTTVVLATMVEETILICHVGDSRAYVVKEGKLQQMTNDHSLVNELIRSGEITAEEGVHHPQRNVVTQSIGTSFQVHPECSQIAIDQVELLILCSDGLNSMLEDDEIFKVIQEEKDIESLGQELIEAANQAGGHDNITLILVSEFKQIEQEGGLA